MWKSVVNKLNTKFSTIDIESKKGLKFASAPTLAVYKMPQLFNNKPKSTPPSPSPPSSVNVQSSPSSHLNDQMKKKINDEILHLRRFPKCLNWLGFFPHKEIHPMTMGTSTPPNYFFERIADNDKLLFWYNQNFKIIPYASKYNPTMPDDSYRNRFFETHTLQSKLLHDNVTVPELQFVKQNLQLVVDDLLDEMKKKWSYGELNTNDATTSLYNFLYNLISLMEMFLNDPFWTKLENAEILCKNDKNALEKCKSIINDKRWYQFRSNQDKRIKLSDEEIMKQCVRKIIQNPQVKEPIYKYNEQTQQTYIENNDFVNTTEASFQKKQLNAFINTCQRTNDDFQKLTSRSSYNELSNNVMSVLFDLYQYSKEYCRFYFQKKNMEQFSETTMFSSCQQDNLLIKEFINQQFSFFQQIDEELFQVLQSKITKALEKIDNNQNSTNTNEIKNALKICNQLLVENEQKQKIIRNIISTFINSSKEYCDSYFQNNSLSETSNHDNFYLKCSKSSSLDSEQFYKNRNLLIENIDPLLYNHIKSKIQYQREQLQTKKQMTDSADETQLLEQKIQQLDVCEKMVTGYFESHKTQPMLQPTQPTLSTQPTQLTSEVTFIPWTGKTKIHKDQDKFKFQYDQTGNDDTNLHSTVNPLAEPMTQDSQNIPNFVIYD